MKKLIFLILLIFSCYDDPEELNYSPSLQIIYYNGSQPTDTFIAGDTITMKIFVYDNDLNSELINIQTVFNSVTIENYNIDIRPQSTNPKIVSLNLNPETAGIYYMTFKVTDAKGNITTQPRQYTLVNP
jgi:hypothetical protein